MAALERTTQPTIALPTPLPLPAQYGILSVLDVAGAGVRWETGVGEWVPLYNGQFISTSTEIVCEGEASKVTPLESPALDLKATPFLVSVVYRCSAFGYSESEIQDRTLLRLATQEDSAVATRLVELLSTAPRLTSTVTASDAQRVAGVLEDQIIQATGSLGILHLSHEAHALINPNFFEYRGGRAFTRTGTPVVISSAYAPLPMFITPQLIAYRATDAQFDGVGRNTSNNNVTAVASRSWMLGVDSSRSYVVTREMLGIDELAFTSLART